MTESKYTREAVIAAYEALDRFTQLSFTGDPATDRYREHEISQLKEKITQTLPPDPQPTMAEVEWNNNKHFLTIAHIRSNGPENGERFIMLHNGIYDDEANHIYCVLEKNLHNGISIIPGEFLIPTREKYTFTKDTTA